MEKQTVEKVKPFTLLGVIMERDGMTRDAAREFLSEVREEMMQALRNGDDAEEVFQELTGLEPDYIIDLL